jgi:hypothetical protein
MSWFGRAADKAAISLMRAASVIELAADRMTRASVDTIRAARDAKVMIRLPL